MTKEEAKRYIGELKMYANSQGWDEEYQIACDIAMNELEQEPILDKIKAEIDKIYKREGNSVDCLNALNELKWFIDKYKGESEET